MKYVQFSDSSKTTVVSVFSCPQSVDVCPNQDVIEDNDPRYLAFADPKSTIKGAQANQTALISAACQQAIYAGATSSALGSPYTYPTDDKNQANMTASVVASTLPNLPANWTTPFLCADSSGVWAMRPHTPSQIQRAASDIRALIVANVEKNATLAAQIAAAQTVAAVQAITW